MKEYCVDELNNMPIEELEELENRLWKYRKRVCAVIEFNKELEKE